MLFLTFWLPNEIQFNVDLHAVEGVAAFCYVFTSFLCFIECERLTNHRTGRQEAGVDVAAAPTERSANAACGRVMKWNRHETNVTNVINYRQERCALLITARPCPVPEQAWPDVGGGGAGAGARVKGSWGQGNRGDKAVALRPWVVTQHDGAHFAFGHGLKVRAAGRKYNMQLRGAQKV